MFSSSNFFSRKSSTTTATTSKPSAGAASSTDSSRSASPDFHPESASSSSMSGMFHALKKTLVKGDARPDAEFIEAKTRFDQYAETCVKLKGNMANYLSHANAVYICSSQIAQDFGTLIEDPDQKSAKSEYSQTVATMRQEHQTLASEQVPKITNTFQTAIISELDQEIARNTEIQKRIVRRIELFGECGYYQKKLNELREERDKRAGKGKPESASDLEKFERNTKKLDEVTITYNEAHSRLMTDLNKLWETERLKSMGPLMKTFITQEIKFAKAYSEALSAIQV